MPTEETEESSSCLVVDEYGAFVGKHSERIQVKVKGELKRERPLLGLEQVMIISGGVSLSADVIRECAERGVQISFISRSGRPYARLVAPDLVGTAQTRRQQLMAYLDSRGVALASAFARGKMQNQANLLKYMAKYRKETDPELYETAREAAFKVEHLANRLAEIGGASVDEVRQPLMNLEARAAKVYWEAARALVIPEVDWPGRETRGAQDLVNSLLNYGYGVLYAQVERAVLLAGLDPYAGFLHEDRAGRPSLVLDLIEEFRQMVVDRTVFGLLNRGVALKVDEAGRLEEETRKTLALKVNERLDSEEVHEGRKLRLKSIVQAQARRIAVFVRGEVAEYRPWVGRW